MTTSTTTSSETVHPEAREMLAAQWGDSKQWADVRKKIMDGSCAVMSDPVSLSCALALDAIASALQQRDEVKGLVEAAAQALASAKSYIDTRTADILRRHYREQELRDEGAWSGVTDFAHDGSGASIRDELESILAKITAALGSGKGEG